MKLVTAQTGIKQAPALLVRHRPAIERELGARKFYEFYKMAWRYIDPAPFSDNWHIRLICEELQRAAVRQSRELLICIPPRSSKSLIVSVAFPAWVWTWWPAAKFITAAYDKTLAGRDALLTRRLVESPWYRERWPETALQPDQNQKTFYQTTAGGQRWIASPDGGVTGHGADFLVFDDPHNVVKGESEAERERALRFWFEAMPSRLNNFMTGVRIVVQQRVHERDVAGECLLRNYRHVVLPALYEPDHPQVHPQDPRKVAGEPLWHDRFPPEAIAQLSKEMGNYAASGQLQQRPTSREGGLFKRHWFQIVDAAPSDLILVRRWDLAGTEQKATSANPDYSACVLMGKSRETGLYYIVHADRLRATPLGVEQAMRQYAAMDGRDVTIGIPQDPGQAGVAQVENFTRLFGSLGHTVRAERETGDKFLRAQPFAAQVEAGNIKMVHGNWNSQFLDELCSFPRGSHDDWVDACAGAFRMLTSSSDGILQYYAATAAALRAAEPSRSLR